MSNANESNITKMWRTRFTEELSSIGVDVPEGISFDDLKALHKKNKAAIPATKAPKPKKAEAKEPAMTEDMIMAAVDKYLKGISAKTESPDQGGAMSESQMVRIMRAVREDSVNKSGNLNPNYVDPKDQIPAVRFFAPYKYFFIRNKELGGYKVALPNSMKVVAFQPDFPKTVVNGGKAKRQYSCYADVTSHALYKWITGKDIEGNDVGLPDPDFRAKYFMDPKEMIVDGFAIWERLYYNHRVSLETKNIAELIRLGEKEAGIEPSSNNDKTLLASLIAKARANKEFASAKQTNDAMRQQSADLASTMFGRPTNPMPLPA